MTAQLLTADDLKKKLRISARQVARVTSQDGFPERVMIGASVRWRESDVDEWITGRQTKGRTQ